MDYIVCLCFLTSSVVKYIHKKKNNPQQKVKLLPLMCDFLSGGPIHISYIIYCHNSSSIIRWSHIKSLLFFEHAVLFLCFHTFGIFFLWNTAALSRLSLKVTSSMNSSFSQRQNHLLFCLSSHAILYILWLKFCSIVCLHDICP
jgi:hypothetical protein